MAQTQERPKTNAQRQREYRQNFIARLAEMNSRLDELTLAIATLARQALEAEKQRDTRR
jgi:hypothetical protein